VRPYAPLPHAKSFARKSGHNLTADRTDNTDR